MTQRVSFLMCRWLDVRHLPNAGIRLGFIHANSVNSSLALHMLPRQRSVGVKTCIRNINQYFFAFKASADNEEAVG